jgi:hypothetical protein
MWKEMEALFETGAEVVVHFRRTEAFNTPAYCVRATWRYADKPSLNMQRYCTKEEVDLGRFDVIAACLTDLLNRYKSQANQ